VALLSQVKGSGRRALYGSQADSAGSIPVTRSTRQARSGPIPGPGLRLSGPLCPRPLITDSSSGGSDRRLIFLAPRPGVPVKTRTSSSPATRSVTGSGCLAGWRTERSPCKATSLVRRPKVWSLPAFDQSRECVAARAVGGCRDQGLGRVSAGEASGSSTGIRSIPDRSTVPATRT
jgi:hypothetical protein